MLEAALTRGQEVLLDIKDSARRRVICGLRWDPMTESSGMTSGPVVKGMSASSAHDLDLLCLTFDKYGRFLDGITGEEGHRTGDRGNIYHTGDVIDGEDLLDDEQISLELFNISSKIHQVFFIAEIQSGQKFRDTINPAMRIANAIDDRNFAATDLGGAAGGEHDSYLFGCIKRVPQGWAFKFIDDYFDIEEITDWSEALKRYVEVAERPSGAGPAPTSPQKGQTVKLFYTPEARHRVVCGLNWDPLESDVTRMEKLKNLGHNIESFDLDLACVMFDADGEAVDGVSAKPEENVDESGKIYHSGDDTSGEGDRTDDEAISVELKGLPEYIHHIIFLAEIQSLHKFGDIINPSMRIADGKTNDDQLDIPLTAKDGADKNAYIFARISRKGESFTLTSIDEFADGDKIEDWIDYLKRYLG